MTVHVETPSRGVAHPSYVFRGHTAQVHSAHIVRRNTCLVTGDADGYVVYWRLESKRPLAVWQAHDGAILGTAEWGLDKLITHGRDNTIRIWNFSGTDAANLSTVLPADGADTHRPKPWLLHSLPVNTLNFCALSMCYAKHTLYVDTNNATPETEHAPAPCSSEPILVAVPARDDKRIEVYQLPGERLVAVVPRVEVAETGMVMAVKLVHHQPSRNTLVVAGYEGGFSAVHLLPRHAKTASGTTSNPMLSIAQTIYLSQPHSQPVLSLDVLPNGTTYFTSAADAIIAAHRIPNLLSREHPDDPQLDAAGTSIDAQEPGARMSFNAREPSSQTGSVLLQAEPAYKTVNTKHAGQQSLRVRSDGRLLVTGGWDSRIRVYSTKTLKEMAVLKWHNEGVYAVDFGVILAAEDGNAVRPDQVSTSTAVLTEKAEHRETGLSRLQRQREEQVQSKHWVVAGAKDGKVSLWEVF